MASDAVFGEVPPGALWASGLTPRVWGVFQSRGGALAASEDDARLQVTDDSGGVREPAPSAQVALPRQLRAALAPLVGRQASRWSRGCRGDRAGRVGGAEPSGSPAAARVSGLELGGSGSPGCARGRRVLGQREVAVAPRGESGEPGTRRLSARPPESSGGGVALAWSARPTVPAPLDGLRPGGGSGRSVLPRERREPGPRLRCLDEEPGGRRARSPRPRDDLSGLSSGAFAVPLSAW